MEKSSGPSKCKIDPNNVSKESPLWALTWAHPRFGNVIAVSSYDGEVSVWRELKPSDWIKVAEHTQHQGSVNAIAWAPPDDGLFLASGASDGNIDF
jgi:protein transport protein SEC13